MVIHTSMCGSSSNLDCLFFFDLKRCYSYYLHLPLQSCKLFSFRIGSSLLINANLPESCLPGILKWLFIQLCVVAHQILIFVFIRPQAVLFVLHFSSISVNIFEWIFLKVARVYSGQFLCELVPAWWLTIKLSLLYTLPSNHLSVLILRLEFLADAMLIVFYAYHGFVP